MHSQPLYSVARRSGTLSLLGFWTFSSEDVAREMSILKTSSDWPESRLSGTLDCVRKRASDDLKQGLLNLEAETGCDSGLCIVHSLCENPGLDEGLRKFLTDTQHEEITELLHICSPQDQSSRPHIEQSNMQWILAFFQ
uniref:Putative antimicrobial peptide microplusin n=2 Tax=Ixodes ricinus TaxID=34613 RepID=V5GGW5_IXORI